MDREDYVVDDEISSGDQYVKYVSLGTVGGGGFELDAFRLKKIVPKRTQASESIELKKKGRMIYVYSIYFDL